MRWLSDLWWWTRYIFVILSLTSEFVEVRAAARRRLSRLDTENPRLAFKTRARP
jgi:hypothetical protein